MTDPTHRPDVTGRVTCQLGLVGVRRVLDSAPLEDAVATQDTVTMLRVAIRGLLGACPPALTAKVRAGLQRADDYTAPGKPACAWTDRRAREALVDALVRDASRAHVALRGERLDPTGGRGGRVVGHGDRPRHRGDQRRPLPHSSRAPRPTGSSPPSIPRPATGTRPPPMALTARPMWRSTPTQRSSARPVSPATSGDAVVAPTLLGDLTESEQGGGQAVRAVAYGDSASGTGANLTWLDAHGSPRW